MEKNTRQGMRPVCRECGGQDLALEASVYWTPGKGAEVGEIFAKGHYCADCGGETRLKWVPEDHPQQEIMVRVKAAHDRLSDVLETPEGEIADAAADFRAAAVELCVALNALWASRES